MFANGVDNLSEEIGCVQGGMAVNTNPFKCEPEN